MLDDKFLALPFCLFLGRYQSRAAMAEAGGRVQYYDRVQSKHVMKTSQRDCCALPVGTPPPSFTFGSAAGFPQDLSSAPPFANCSIQIDGCSFMQESLLTGQKSFNVDHLRGGRKEVMFVNFHLLCCYCLCYIQWQKIILSPNIQSLITRLLPQSSWVQAAFGSMYKCEMTSAKISGFL